MRLGFDITPITRNRSGVGTFCYYLLKHLLQLAPDTAVAGFSSGGAHVDLGPLDGAVSHRHIPVPTRLLYHVWSWLRAPKVDQFLGGVDVYHATNYFLPPTRTARTVLTIYDLSFLAVPERCSPRIVGPFSRKVAQFARRADAILTCSEATKTDIVSRWKVDPAQITVTPGAVDEAFSPMDRRAAARYLEEHYGVRGPFILFAGTLEPRKNVPGLLRAFVQIASSIPHTLVLVGQMGWNTGEILDTLRAINLGERIRRVGYVPRHAELAVFYSAADAFVFPSFYEGFGLPVIEALTCGCPVVTAANSSLPEVAGDAALYADPDVPEEIAAAIMRLLEDASLRESCIAKGNVQARRFSWAACARATLDVYRRLMP